MANKKWKPSDIVTVAGKTQDLAALAAEVGTPVQTILGRLARGWSIDDACLVATKQTGGSNKGKKADADVLAVDEVQQLLSAGRKSQTAVRDTAILVIAYRTGLRC